MSSACFTAQTLSLYCKLVFLALTACTSNLYSVHIPQHCARYIHLCTLDTFNVKWQQETSHRGVFLFQGKADFCNDGHETRRQDRQCRTASQLFSCPRFLAVQ
ncbi:hypothetical protein IWZ01DRAFT_21568 [Phyllosticta capitalensis]